MPSKIRVLDENTINQIAAGEVIENPSSVVKELVENSIDAGATEIVVEIKGGGRQLIRISDNGCGMSKDDALLCLERHATSKIRALDDIHHLSTMGFRGEAVPSIASISKMTLITRSSSDEKGTLISIDGGRILHSAAAERAPGTTFEVKSLFFNVPVRKKFQRSPAFDAQEVLKMVSTQALAHPEIKFELISNEEKILSAKLPEKQTLIEKIGERICQVLGKDYFVGLAPVEKEENGYSLVGYLGLPSYTRHNRTGQYLFINRRAVFSPLVSYAVRDGFGTALATNRHPIFVLFLTMDGTLVDVNVHPQKREVRLRQDFQIKEFITKAAEEGLNLSWNSKTPAFESLPEPKVSFFKSLSSIPQPFQLKTSEPPRESAALREHQIPDFHDHHEIPSPPLFAVQERGDVPFHSSKVIGALQGYLLLTAPDGAIYLLDSRAAHARILFEELMETGRKNGNLPVQHLLIPYTLELCTEETNALKEHLDYFNQLGLNLQLFGENTFSINSIPQIFRDADIKEIIMEVLHDLETHQSEGIVQGEVQKRISQTAARAAISKNKRLTIAEGQGLLQQLMKCQRPGICPQGKPTVVELRQEEIAKQFQK